MNLGPSPADEQFPQLLSRAHTDGKAMGKLLEWARPLLLSISNSELPEELKAKLGASDVVQDTILEIIKSFHQFGGTTAAEFRGWICSVLRNNLRDSNRRFREAEKRAVERERALDDDDSRGNMIRLLAVGDSPSDQAVMDEQLQALARALDALPKHYRQVLELHHWQRLTFEEIGKITDRSTDAARMLWWRALERLQEDLDRRR